MQGAADRVGLPIALGKVVILKCCQGTEFPVPIVQPTRFHQSLSWPRSLVGGGRLGRGWLLGAIPLRTGHLGSRIGLPVSGLTASFRRLVIP
jgi:hypothetical protein